MDSIGVRELRQHASRYLARVDHLADLGAEPLVSSALVRVEVVRAVRRAAPAAVDAARRAVGALHLVPLDRSLLDEAAEATEAGPGVLRTLEALHLASARRVAASLRHVVTYDTRLRDAAHDLGLTTVAPA